MRKKEKANARIMEIGREKEEKKRNRNETGG